MGAQRGKDILLKVADAKGSYVTCAGMRSKRLAFNTQAVDVTDADAVGRWRELLAGSAVQHASIGGAGLFKDAQSDALFRQAFFNGEIPLWQIVLPDFGMLQGSFQITALEYGGAYNGEVTFEIALESAGPITFKEIA
ncbi:phage major tail protein, TP901-1 family [Phyllobacterium bourgognense]|uniref:TP901-1 family phage major tail protein n=1 Tax=Phyllobacterium bourgognense TaxID=314236 RepID=A0A368YJQ5_9HYPH|nr:phage major tail protein, TP901-1 family [Phyllobacterium bourgognense]RCW79546.1 TP901-1 family phage major tail protein [Phyllobacterium bourgognense]